MSTDSQSGLDGFSITAEGKVVYNVPQEEPIETDESRSIHEAQAAAIIARQAGSRTRIFADVHVSHNGDAAPEATGNRNKGY